MPDGFVFKLVAEVPKGRIQNALGQLGVRHPLHAQAVDAEPGEPPSTGQLFDERSRFADGRRDGERGRASYGPSQSDCSPACGRKASWPHRAASVQLCGRTALQACAARHLWSRTPSGRGQSPRYRIRGWGKRRVRHLEQRDAPVPIRLPLAELDPPRLRHVQALPFGPYPHGDAESGGTPVFAPNRENLPASQRSS